MSFTPSGMGAFYGIDAVQAHHNLALLLIARGEIALTMTFEADPERFIAAVQARTRQLLAEERSERSGLILRADTPTPTPQPQTITLPTRSAPRGAGQNVTVHLVGILIPGPYRANMLKPNPAGVEFVTRLAEEGFEVTLVIRHELRQVTTWLNRWNLSWAVERLAREAPATGVVVTEERWNALGMTGVFDFLTGLQQAA